MSYQTSLDEFDFQDPLTYLEKFQVRYLKNEKNQMS